MILFNKFQGLRMSDIIGEKIGGSGRSMSEKLSDIATATTYTGGGITVFGYLSAHDLALFAGVLIALAGFCVNWYYKYKHYKLAETEYNDRRRSERRKPE